jgi:hypothetical protein
MKPKVVKREDGFDIMCDKESWVAKTKLPLHITADKGVVTFRTHNGKNPLTVKDIADLGYL